MSIACAWYTTRRHPDPNHPTNANKYDEQNEIRGLLIGADGVRLGQFTKNEMVKRAQALTDTVLKIVSESPPVYRLFKRSQIPQKPEIDVPKKITRKGKPAKGVNERGKKDQEIKCHLNISDHDLKVKAKNALRLAKKGSDVKFMLEITNHEKFDPSTYPNREYLLQKVIDFVQKTVDVTPPVHEGRRSFIFLTAKNS
eukprot:CFRG5525T1